MYFNLFKIQQTDNIGGLLKKIPVYKFQNKAEIYCKSSLNINTGMYSHTHMTIQVANTILEQTHYSIPLSFADTIH